MASSANTSQISAGVTPLDRGRCHADDHRLAADAELASRPDYIVPGHDPLVMSRYRAPSPSLRGVIVRLDAEPEEVSDATPQR
jgi:hypothetical protein